MKSNPSSAKPKVIKSKSVTFASDVKNNEKGLPGDSLGKLIKKKVNPKSEAVIDRIISTLASRLGHPAPDQDRALDALTSVTSALSQQVKAQKGGVSAPVKRLEGALDLGSKFQMVMATDLICPDSDVVHPHRAGPEWLSAWDGVSDEYAKVKHEAESAPDRVYTTYNVSPQVSPAKSAGDKLGPKTLQMFSSNLDASVRGNSSVEEDRLSHGVKKIISESPLKLLNALGAEVLPAISAGIRADYLTILNQVQASFRLPARLSERRMQEWTTQANDNVFAAINKHFHESEVRTFLRALNSPDMRWGSGVGAFSKIFQEVESKILFWFFLCFIAFFFRNENFDFEVDIGLALDVGFQLTTNIGGGPMSIPRMSAVFRHYLNMCSYGMHPLEYLANEGRPRSQNQQRSRPSTSSATRNPSNPRNPRNPPQNNSQQGGTDNNENRFRNIEKSIGAIVRLFGSNQRVGDIARNGLITDAQGAPDRGRIPNIMSCDRGVWSLLSPFK